MDLAEVAVVPLQLHRLACVRRRRRQWHFVFLIRKTLTGFSFVCGFLSLVSKGLETILIRKMMFIFFRGFESFFFEPWKTSKERSDDYKENEEIWWSGTTFSVIKIIDQRVNF